MHRYKNLLSRFSGMNVGTALTQSGTKKCAIDTNRFSGSHFVTGSIGSSFLLSLPLLKVHEPVLCESFEPTVQEIRPDREVVSSHMEPYPVWLHPLISFSCLGLYVGVWLTAVFGPIFVAVCALSGWWDYLISFLIIWFTGSLISLPFIPSFSDFVSSGIESWFKQFSIQYEHTHNPELIPVASRRPTIYCYHPHGLFSIGAGLLAANLARRGEKVAIVASSHMRWFNPVAKLLLDMAGIELIGASPKDVQNAMKRGTQSLILVIGGYEEAVMTQDGAERLHLKDRMGFVKYAMRYNYTLTPVYAYGENDLYKCVNIAEGFRKLLAQWKVPIAAFYGHPSMPLLPRKTDEGLRIVVGEPMKVLHHPNPPIQELRQSHEWYVEALMKLYYRNNRNDRILEIF